MQRLPQYSLLIEKVNQIEDFFFEEKNFNQF